MNVTMLQGKIRIKIFNKKQLTIDNTIEGQKGSISALVEYQHFAVLDGPLQKIANN